MKRKGQSKSKNSIGMLMIAVFLFVSGFPIANMVYADNESKNESETYFYDPMGKPDPFLPFIKVVPKAKKNVVGKKVVKTEGGVIERPVFLPPLQRLDLEMFRLVGIGESDKGRIAMVEEPNGKFYVLRKGTRIGLSGGEVVKINSDQIVIVEKTKDTFGKIKSNRVILKLQSVEDEGEL
jgi:type IV pilus assembly protein PilP